MFVRLYNKIQNWFSENKTNRLDQHPSKVELRYTSLVIAGFVFTTSTTLAQMVTVNKTVLVYVFIANLVVWLIVLYIHIRTSKNRIQKKTSKQVGLSLNDPTDLESKFVESISELRRISQCDQEEYNEQNIHFDLLAQWWTKNKKGIFFCENQGEIMAAMGIWPITQRMYEDLVHGRIVSETEFTAADIIPEDQERNHKYWHISGFFERFTGNNNLSNLFLADCLENLIGRIGDENSQIHLSYFPLIETEVDFIRNLKFGKTTNKKGLNLALYTYYKNSLSDIRKSIILLRKTKTAIDLYEVENNLKKE